MKNWAYELDEKPHDVTSSGCVVLRVPFNDKDKYSQFLRDNNYHKFEVYIKK